MQPQFYRVVMMLTATTDTYAADLYRSYWERSLLMAMPSGIPIVDTMIGFPQEGFGQYDFIRKQTKDKGSRQEMQFPAEYMFKNVPKDLPTSDPVSVTLHEMDRFGIEAGLIGVADDVSRLALKKHRDRFIPAGNIGDPNDVTGTVRAMRRQYEEFGIRAVGVFPAGTFPQVAIDDPKMYPVYQAWPKFLSQNARRVLNCDK